MAEAQLAVLSSYIRITGANTVFFPPAARCRSIILPAQFLPPPKNEERLMKLLPLRGVVPLVVVAAMTLVVWQDAVAQEVAFPTNYKSGVLYNIVDREDRTEVHEQYTSHEALVAAEAGRPLPRGTVITSANYKALLDPQGNPVRDPRGNFLTGELVRIVVMEKRAGWGREYPDNLRNGEWEFAAFTPGRLRDTQMDTKVCMECHKAHDHLDYVKTYLAMAGKRVQINPTSVPVGALVATVVRCAVNPGHLKLRVGTPVTWVNADDKPHQFLVEGTSLKTDYLLKGQSGTVVIKAPGVYHYRDTFLPSVEALQGDLEVK
jgi:plastocyanin